MSRNKTEIFEKQYTESLESASHKKRNNKYCLYIPPQLSPIFLSLSIPCISSHSSFRPFFCLLMPPNPGPSAFLSFISHFACYPSPLPLISFRPFFRTEEAIGSITFTKRIEKTIFNHLAYLTSYMRCVFK